MDSKVRGVDTAISFPLIDIITNPVWYQLPTLTNKSVQVYAHKNDPSASGLSLGISSTNLINDAPYWKLKINGTTWNNLTSDYKYLTVYVVADEVVEQGIIVPLREEEDSYTIVKSWAELLKAETDRKKSIAIDGTITIPASTIKAFTVFDRIIFLSGSFTFPATGTNIITLKGCNTKGLYVISNDSASLNSLAFDGGEHFDFSDSSSTHTGNFTLDFYYATCIKYNSSEMVSLYKCFYRQVNSSYIYNLTSNFEQIVDDQRQLNTEVTWTEVTSWAELLQAETDKKLNIIVNGTLTVPASTAKVFKNFKNISFKTGSFTMPSSGVNVIEISGADTEGLNLVSNDSASLNQFTLRAGRHSSLKCDSFGVPDPVMTIINADVRGYESTSSNDIRLVRCLYSDIPNLDVSSSDNIEFKDLITATGVANLDLSAFGNVTSSKLGDILQLIKFANINREELSNVTGDVHRKVFKDNGSSLAFENIIKDVNGDSLTIEEGKFSSRSDPQDL